MNKKITIITPTTGKDGLFKLIESLDRQPVSFNHILLWDDKRDGDYLYPKPHTLDVKDPYELNSNNRYSIVIPGSFVQSEASGSSLRAIGLMVAQTPYVTFLDDDCWCENNHLENLLGIIGDKNWAYCRRKIWTSDNEYLGIDNFESVGDSSDRTVSYEMVDNNCMIFSRRFGTSGAVIYRETKNYNDDRLFYAFLKENAGEPGQTRSATINQVCPEKLELMFRENCTGI